MDTNKIAMTGNLTRDPRVRDIGNDRIMASFGIASNRYWQTSAGEKKSEVCFVEVTCFGLLAEKVREHAIKGTRVWVEGRLKFDRWDDKKTGEKRSKHSISADNILIMSGRATGKQLRGDRRPRQQSDQRHGVVQGPPPPPGDDDIRDEDIPPH